jgi:Na+/H+ antiporter
LLALEFTVALVVTGNRPSYAESGGRLLYLVLGGVFVGLVVGKIVYWFEGYIDDAPIETTISLVTPFIAYLAAESLHSSGVLATVACGLFLGRQSATYFSSQSRIEAFAVWNTLTFALNGIVFILIGLQLPSILASIKTYGLADLVSRAAVMTGLLVALRIAWVYPGAYVSYFIRNKLLGQTEPRPSPRAIFVVGWTGMRGVVALAAAISLPETLDNGSPFPQRSVILFMTFCVIFVTLVVQELTLPALIRRLGLAGLSSGNNEEEEEARRTMIAAALKHLEESEEKRIPELAPIYEDLAMHYQRRLASLSRSERDGGEVSLQQDQMYRDLAQTLRKIEYATAIELRNKNQINDEVLRTLQRDLDFVEAQPGSS